MATMRPAERSASAPLARRHHPATVENDHPPAPEPGAGGAGAGSVRTWSCPARTSAAVRFRRVRRRPPDLVPVLLEDVDDPIAARAGGLADLVPDLRLGDEAVELRLVRRTEL